MSRRTLRFPSFLACTILLAGLELSSSRPSYAQQAVETSQTATASLMQQHAAELQQVVNRWSDAVTRHDQYALELVLAPQFTDISDTGQVLSRDEMISETFRRNAPHITLTQKVTHVRLVGDVAIITGTYDRLHESSRLSRARSTDEEGVFSQVYIRSQNRWECINSQRTLLPESSEKAAGKKSKDKSEEKLLPHDLGFHLPGLPHDSKSN